MPLSCLYSPAVASRKVDSLARHQWTSKPVSKKRFTRDDVAARAGVPPSTVSYVINNGPRPVSAMARERVLEAIAELGYQPSEVARSLRPRRTRTIGLVFPDFANAFFVVVARSFVA